MTLRPAPRWIAGPAAAALGLFAAGLVWLLFQQGAGVLVYFRCRSAGPPLGMGLGVAAITACGAAGWLAWRVSKRSGTPARRFLGLVGLGAAAIFTLASMVMTAAIWIEPACAR